MGDKRLIDANALEKALHEKVNTLADENGWHDHYVSGFDDAITYVEDAPTIDAVEVVHGRWDKPIEHGLPYAANNLGVVCSNCCKWSDNDYNYCPNCGAKMDGGAPDV